MWCLCSLSGLTPTDLKLDKFGLLQLSKPPPPALVRSFFPLADVVFTQVMWVDASGASSIRANPVHYPHGPLAHTACCCVMWCRLVWCLRSLSGLTASGLKLDKYGLLQLSSPNLSDVLTTLLAVVTVLRVYVRSTVRVCEGGCNYECMCVCVWGGGGAGVCLGNAVRMHGSVCGGVGSKVLGDGGQLDKSHSPTCAVLPLPSLPSLPHNLLLAECHPQPSIQQARPLGLRSVGRPCSPSTQPPYQQQQRQQQRCSATSRGCSSACTVGRVADVCVPHHEYVRGCVEQCGGAGTAAGGH